jgi:hypothetical protein
LAGSMYILCVREHILLKLPDGVRSTKLDWRRRWSASRAGVRSTKFDWRDLEDHFSAHQTGDADGQPPRFLFFKLICPPKFLSIYLIFYSRKQSLLIFYYLP